MPASMRCLPFRSEPGGGDDRYTEVAELARGIVTGGQDGTAGLGSGVLVATRARPAPRPGAPSSPSGKPSPTLREPRAALDNSPFTAHRELASSHLGAKSK